MYKSTVSNRPLGAGLLLSGRGAVLKITTRLLPVVAALVAFSVSGLTAPSESQADNTNANKSQQGASPTADQGKNNKSDLQTMQRIRKAVIADKSLSSYAHNVKIIATDGKVTLKGPVRSDAEKASIEQKAVDVVGAGNVTNEITIKPAQ
jgi:hyperosmotically inducible protein